MLNLCVQFQRVHCRSSLSLSHALSLFFKIWSIYTLRCTQYMYTRIYRRDIYRSAAHSRAGEKKYPRLNRKSISPCHIAITVRFSQKPETSHRSPVIQRGNFGSADPRPGKSFAAMQNRDSPSNDSELRWVLGVQKRRLRATFAPAPPEAWNSRVNSVQKRSRQLRRAIATGARPSPSPDRSTFLMQFFTGI